MPDYMRFNPELWLFENIEDCCENYYSWEKDECMEGSGGGHVITATGKWYANHQDLICQRDCIEGSDGTCGGLAYDWDQLYDTAEECCNMQLSWIASPVCEGQSNLSTVIGTSFWFVDWGLEKVR